MLLEKNTFENNFYPIYSFKERHQVQVIKKAEEVEFPKVESKYFIKANTVDLDPLKHNQIIFNIEEKTKKKVPINPPKTEMEMRIDSYLL